MDAYPPETWRAKEDCGRLLPLDHRRRWRDAQIRWFPSSAASRCTTRTPLPPPSVMSQPQKSSLCFVTNNHPFTPPHPLSSHNVWLYRPNKGAFRPFGPFSTTHCRHSSWMTDSNEKIVLLFLAMCVLSHQMHLSFFSPSLGHGQPLLGVLLVQKKRVK